jgi:hypothetical protein
MQSWAASAIIRHIRQRIYRSTMSVIGCQLEDKNDIVSLCCRAQVCHQKSSIVNEREM